MEALIRTVFTFLIGFTLIYMYLLFRPAIEFLFIHWSVAAILLIAVVFIAVLVSQRFAQILEKLRWHVPVQLLTSIALIVFFNYQLFTPYFFSESHLRAQALNQVTERYDAFDPGLSEEERMNRLKDSHTELMVFSYHHSDSVEPELLGAAALDFERTFNRFHVTMEIEGLDRETDEILDMKEYVYTFVREGGEFKIAGFTRIN